MASRGPGAALTSVRSSQRGRTIPGITDKLRTVVFGGSKNPFDPRIHQHLALIAFFAWVGLGSDGLSSSCYGPEEIFRQLGAHRHLALYLVGAVVATVFLISASYRHIIEQFPSGGGGYLVATKLLGAGPGVVSGSALVVDYVLSGGRSNACRRVRSTCSPSPVWATGCARTTNATPHRATAHEATSRILAGVRPNGEARPSEPQSCEGSPQARWAIVPAPRASARRRTCL